MSFYGTILNNYPESYEPNLGKVQEIEKSFKSINTRIDDIDDQLSGVKNEIDGNNGINDQISDIHKNISDINKNISDINNKISGVDNIGGYRIYKQVWERTVTSPVTRFRFVCGNNADPNLHNTTFNDDETVILLSAITHWSSEFAEQNKFKVFTVNVMKQDIDDSTNKYNYYFHLSSNETFEGPVTVTVYYIILNNTHK